MYFQTYKEVTQTDNESSKKFNIDFLAPKGVPYHTLKYGKFLLKIVIFSLDGVVLKIYFGPGDPYSELCFMEKPSYSYTYSFSTLNP